MATTAPPVKPSTMGYSSLLIRPFCVLLTSGSSPPTTDKMAKKIEANPHWIASIYVTKI